MSESDPRKRQFPGAGIRAVALLVATLTLGGCYKVTLVGDPFGTRASRPDHEEWTDFWALGFIGQAEIDTRRYCGDGVSRVHTGGNVATVAVSVLTLGIYSPRIVYVNCAAQRGPVLLPPSPGEGTK